MAVVKWTGVVTSMKGVLRGSVFQMGAGGQILRSNRQINQSGNLRWNAAKTNCAGTVYQWQSLSPSDRATWAAATVNFPTTDRYGGTHYPSPYTLFQRLNIPLNYHLNAPNTSAPTPQTFDNLGTVSAVAVAATPQVIVYWTLTYSSPLYMLIGATVSMSAGRRPPKGYTTKIGLYTNYSGLSQDITTDYISRFGILQPNAVVFFSIRLLSPVSGQLTPAYITSAYT